MNLKRRDMNIPRRPASFNLDLELMRECKIAVIREHTTMSALVEDLLLDWLDSRREHLDPAQRRLEAAPEVRRS